MLGVRGVDWKLYRQIPRKIETKTLAKIHIELRKINMSLSSSRFVDYHKCKICHKSRDLLNYTPPFSHSAYLLAYTTSSFPTKLSLWSSDLGQMDVPMLFPLSSNH